MEKSISNNNLIAPCGMNCGVCIAYLRDKNSCCGCNNEGNKPKHCISCVIKNCDNLDKGSNYCYDCDSFPCVRLKQLDTRYRKNYKTSLIENLKDIQLNGLDSFLEKEASKWTCLHCGNTISIHRDTCTKCKTINLNRSFNV